MKGKGFNEERAWNANLGFVESVIDQLNRTNEAVSDGNPERSINCLGVLYGMAAIKIESEDEMKPYNEQMSEISSLYTQILSTTEAISKRVMIAKLRNLINLFNRDILRLMARMKLIKLDVEKYDPMKEIKEGYE